MAIELIVGPALAGQTVEHQVSLANLAKPAFSRSAFTRGSPPSSEMGDPSVTETSVRVGGMVALTGIEDVKHLFPLCWPRLSY